MLIQTANIEAVIYRLLKRIVDKASPTTKLYNYEVGREFAEKSYIVYYIANSSFSEFTFNKQLNIGEHDLVVKVGFKNNSPATTIMANNIINVLQKYKTNSIRRIELDGVSRVRSNPENNPYKFKHIDFTVRTQ